MKGLIEMIKRNWPIVALVLALAAVAGFGFKGCDEKQQLTEKQQLEKQEQREKAIRQTVRVGAASAREFKNELADLCRAELLKPEQCDKAKPYAERVSAIAERLDKFLDKHQKLTVESREEALGIVDEIVNELDDMELKGEIKIEDPEKRRRFLLALAFVKSGVRVARVAIETAPIEQPSPSPSPAE